MKKALFVILISLSISVSFAQVYDYSPGFDAGKPGEMNKLDFMAGEWDITEYWTSEKYSPKPAWQFFTRSQSTFSPVFDGTYIREVSKGFLISPPHEGFSWWEYTATYSYDRYNRAYRCIVQDNIIGLQDIYEGNFKNDSLILSNWKTNTFVKNGFTTVPEKNTIVITEISDDRFVLTWRNVDVEQIPDSAEYNDIPWKWSIKMVFSRKLTNIKYEPSSPPQEFELSQNFPNPFNPATTINYIINQNENVSIIIYNSKGQKIRTLVNSLEAAGKKSIVWDGTDDAGNKVSTGTYFYRLQTGTKVGSKKMLLLK